MLVTVLILSYIYNTFNQDQYQFSSVAHTMSGVFSQSNIFKIGIMILLVPVNWALESLKWMYLARTAVNINFREAFRSTLTGLALGVAVPAQIGDTIGRVASLKSSRRLTSIGAALVSNGIQFYVAIAAGFAGLLFMHDQLTLNHEWLHILQYFLVFLLILGVLTGIFRKKLIHFNTRRKWSRNLSTYLKVIGEYSAYDLLLALLLGSFRYIIFLLQFILSLSLFSLGLSFETLIAPTALLLLAKTLIPALNTIGDLGIRGIIILWVFESYHLPDESLIAATLIIWIINILGPLMAGLIMIWKYNWKFN